MQAPGSHQSSLVLGSGPRVAPLHMQDTLIGQLAHRRCSGFSHLQLPVPRRGFRQREV